MVVRAMGASLASRAQVAAASSFFQPVESGQGTASFVVVVLVSAESRRGFSSGLQICGGPAVTSPETVRNKRRPVYPDAVCGFDLMQPCHLHSLRRLPVAR